MKPKKTTIKDIAQACGVSTITVSRAIAGHSNVRDSTRQFIFEKMKEMNYQGLQKIISENSLKDIKPENTTLPRYIAVLMDTLLDYRSQEIAMEIAARLSQRDYLSLICYCNSDTIWKYFDMYQNKQVAGFISVSLLGTQSDALSDASEKGIPLVVLHRCPLFSSSHSVVTDDYTNAYMAIEHLASLGHKNIILLNNSEELAGSRETTMGYHMAAHKFGTEDRADYIYYCTAYSTGVQEAFEKAYQEHPEVTAIICTSESAATTVCDCCAAQGLSVPEDMSVIAFDSSDTPSIRHMTSVGATYSRLAEVTVDTILRFIEFPNEAPKETGVFSKTILKSELRPGFSTSAPAKR